MFLETLDSGTTYHMTDNANILTNIVKSIKEDILLAENFC